MTYTNDIDWKAIADHYYADLQRVCERNERLLAVVAAADAILACAAFEKRGMITGVHEALALEWAIEAYRTARKTMK